MGSVRIYGINRSTYVKTVRWALEEKGVEYELVPPPGGGLTSPEFIELHPFSKIPVLEHDDHHIFESSAICAYVDEAFDGPLLQPADVLDRARMRQWISVATAYLDPTVLRGYVFAYAFADGDPDQAQIEAALPACEQYTEILDRALEGRDYLVSDRITIADMMIAPMFWAFGAFHEGKEILARRPNLKRAVKGWMDHPGFQATLTDPA